MTVRPQLDNPTGRAPLPPLVEPRQHDWNPTPADCKRADEDYWADRFDTEPDEPSAHYYC